MALHLARLPFVGGPQPLHQEGEAYRSVRLLRTIRHIGGHNVKPNLRNLRFGEGCDIGCAMQQIWMTRLLGIVTMTDQVGEAVVAE